MHWILQNNIFSETGWDTLIESLQRHEVPYSEHKVVPFVGLLDPIPNLDTNNVICFGSYSMRHFAKEAGWNPGVFDLEPFDFNVQLEHWGDGMLNHDSQVLPFGEVKFTEDHMFIRPILDSKSFAGKVFEKEEFKTWQKLVVDNGTEYGYTVDSNTLVQLTRPKEIYQEARFWIVNGRIVTSSMYKIGSRVSYAPVIDRRFDIFASSRVSAMSVDCWNPLPAFCLDICDTPEGMKVVEINTINSSGFYAADVQQLMLTLEAEFSK